MTRRIWDPGRGPGDTNALPAGSVRLGGPFFPRQSIGICDSPEKGENASHKPVLPLPALAGWGAGRAVSGEAQGWFRISILFDSRGMNAPEGGRVLQTQP